MTFWIGFAVGAVVATVIIFALVWVADDPCANCPLDRCEE